MGILIVGGALAFIGLMLLMALGAASMLARLVLAVFGLPEADGESRPDAVDGGPAAPSGRLDENAHHRR